MSRRGKPQQAGTVYLIHFESRLKHAGHHLGFATDLPQRMAQHRDGNGARLLEVIAAAGIGWKVVRTWGGTGPSSGRSSCGRTRRGGSARCAGARCHTTPSMK
jgi:hypothetical protein